jgi:N-succinyldiaminopimelate aminotransferase
MYETKRQLMLTALAEGGMTCVAPEGTYFVMADFSPIFKGTPYEFTRHLIQNAGVACIPPESFYGQERASLGKNYVRFAFCKSDAMLQEVGRRLIQLSHNKQSTL